MILPGKKYSAQANARAIKAALSGCVNNGVSRYGQDVCVDAMEEDRRAAWWISTDGDTSVQTNACYRHVLPPTLFTQTGTRCRFTFAAGSSNAGGITAAYIGTQAASGNPYDFAGDQVPITFDGSQAVNITAGTTVVSDWIDFEINGLDSLVLSHRVPNNASYAYFKRNSATDKGIFEYYQSAYVEGGEYADAPSSFVVAMGAGWMISCIKIEVSGSTYDSTTDTASGSDISMRTPLAYYSEAGVIAYPFGEEKARRKLVEKALSTQDTYYEMGSGFTYAKGARAFTFTEDVVVTSIRGIMQKVGTVTGTVDFFAYAVSGILPTGSPLISGAIDAAIVPTSMAAMDCNVGGVKLDAGTYAFGYGSSAGTDSSNCIRRGVDTLANSVSSVYHSTNGWTADASNDLCLEVWGYTAEDRTIRRLTVAALDDTAGKLFARASLDGGVTWTPKKVMQDQGASVGVYHVHTIDLDVAHLSGSVPVYEITTDSADHAVRGAAMILE